MSERIPSIQYLGTGADESRYCQRREPQTQQPRALPKDARLLVTMHKRILRQRLAVGMRCTMLNTQTSHVQQLTVQFFLCGFPESGREGFLQKKRCH